MFNIANISKVVKNLTAYFKKVGSKEFIKTVFITPYGYYTNPKDKRGLLLDNKYIIALHNHKNIPIKLNSNDIILTDGKTYLHIDFKSDNINIHMSNNLNEDIGNNKNVNVGKDYNLNIGNNLNSNIKNNLNEDIKNDKNISIGSNLNEDIGNNKNVNVDKVYNLNVKNINVNISNDSNIFINSNSNENIGKDKNISIGSNLNENIVKDYNLQATNINLTASDTISLTAPNIKFNTDNLTFNCKVFEVNASVGIKFNSPSGSFTHNGVNVGDTHKHKMTQVVWGVSDTDVPH